jgi:hypothetical protein
LVKDHFNIIIYLKKFRKIWIIIIIWLTKKINIIIIKIILYMIKTKKILMFGILLLNPKPKSKNKHLYNKVNTYYYY